MYVLYVLYVLYVMSVMFVYFSCKTAKPYPEVTMRFVCFWKDALEANIAAELQKRTAKIMGICNHARCCGGKVFTCAIQVNALSLRCQLHFWSICALRRFCLRMATPWRHWQQCGILSVMWSGVSQFCHIYNTYI